MRIEWGEGISFRVTGGVVTRDTGVRLDSGHIVQLFDTPDTLGASVSRFLHDGFAAGANAIVIARPASVQAISRALTASGLSLPSLIQSGRITLVDAAATLESLMDGTRLNRKRFHSVIASLLRQVRQTSATTPLLYGEMVEILATEGNFDAAVELEDLWNELATLESFTLLCGYQAAHFTGDGGHDALRSICARHTHVNQDHSDLLATWLLGEANAGV